MQWADQGSAPACGCIFCMTGCPVGNGGGLYGIPLALVNMPLISVAGLGIASKYGIDEKVPMSLIKAALFTPCYINQIRQEVMYMENLHYGCGRLVFDGALMHQR